MRVLLAEWIATVNAVARGRAQRPRRASRRASLLRASGRPLLAAAGLALSFVFLGCGGGTPILNASGPSHSIETCISGGDTNTDSSDSDATFGELAVQTGQHERGYFNWHGTDSSAPTVEFYFFNDAPGSQRGVAAAEGSDALANRLEPKVAERHNNLLITYQRPPTPAQASRIDHCLNAAGAGGRNATFSLITPAVQRRAAQLNAQQEGKVRSDRADPYLRFLAWDGALGRCEDKIAPGQLPSSNDPQRQAIAPALANRLHTLRGKFNPNRYVELYRHDDGNGNPQPLPAGIDYLYFYDNQTARAALPEAHAALRRWPGGQATLVGPTMIMIAHSTPPETFAATRKCAEQANQGIASYIAGTNTDVGAPGGQ